MNAVSSSLVVLPDSPGGAALLPRVPYQRPSVLFHSSGRPWLAGRWEPGDIRVAIAGRARVAVFGFCPMPVERLTARTACLRTAADADALARVLPGSAHLIASVNGQVRLQGTLTNLRRAFHTRVGPTAIAGTRADLLAEMTGAGVDEDLLAAHLTQMQLLPPLIEQSWWRTVHSVPPDSYVALAEDGTARTVRWWRPPEPVLPIRKGAPAVRTALREAVADRRPTNGRLSADLSGGMDSTTLCFLAAEHTPDLLTFRCTEGSVVNDDPYFAAEAARLLPRAEHLDLLGDDAPALFAPPYSTADLEAPWATTRGLNSSAHGIRLLAERGTGLHLAGYGGDEVFSASPGYLHTLIRRRPITGLRHLRVYRALGRWSWRRTLAGLASRQSWGGWWRESADHLTDPLPRRGTPELGWADVVRASPWATGDALATTRRVLYEIAGEATPLAADRGQHEALTSLRAAGPLSQQVQREYADHGVPLELPYLDDRVVEAALAVRTADRFTPWRYKPLLADAMRGLVPDFILDRTTKGDYQDDDDAEAHRHVPDLLGYFADSALAARGLLDLDALRAALLEPRLDDEMEAHLETALGCEMWLRAIAEARPATDRRTHAPAP
ncbi:asparagine synthase-related protein [Amycolatopsis halotolerans]|uniref:asparagine synthase (glutamine-hydrolyzing) n=1 Tax=Amycolatopsis halotolerans TaxID=330083 RepID=A0ABV7QPL4_9PSEU